MPDIKLDFADIFFGDQQIDDEIFRRMLCNNLASALEEEPPYPELLEEQQ